MRFLFPDLPSVKPDSNYLKFRSMLQIAFWLFVVMGVFANSLLYLQGKELLVDLLLTFSVLFISVYVNYLILLPYLFRSKKILNYLLLLVLLILAVVQIHYQFDRHFESELVPMWLYYGIYLPFLITYIGMTGLFRFAEAWYFEQKVQGKAENAKLEMEASALRARIQPHFLFNTLNNIYALSVEGSKHTSEMIRQLSNLLRYLSSPNQNGLISLSEERKAAENLIALYNLKSDFPSRVETVFPEKQSVQIPRATILTLLENAYKHGDILNNLEGWISLIVKSNSKDNWEIVISNSVSSSFEAIERDNTGLDDLRRILALQYGNKVRIETEKKDNVFCTMISHNDE